MIIQVGKWRGDYLLYRTNALRSYDPGATITLYENGVPGKSGYVRVIAILKEEVEYHRQRFLSGLFVMEPEDTQQLEPWASDVILKRILERPT